MKTNITLAVLSSALVASAILLSFRHPVSAESIVGYASVVALLSVASLEYRINWKRLFTRN